MIIIDSVVLEDSDVICVNYNDQENDHDDDYEFFENECYD
jgi:hypothetical protein